MEQSRMTQDDVLFGYRLQLLDLAARTTVSNACRVFGVHRSTYYRWKGQVERSGLEMLRPGSGGVRRCPTSSP
jgi:transposase